MATHSHRYANQTRNCRIVHQYNIITYRFTGSAVRFPSSPACSSRGLESHSRTARCRSKKKCIFGRYALALSFYYILLYFILSCQIRTHNGHFGRSIYIERKENKYCKRFVRVYYIICSNVI